MGEKQIVVEDSPEALAKLITERRARLVAIDGSDGVGKTTLARSIAKLINATAIDLDSYVNKNQGAFVAALRIDELKQTLEAAFLLGRPAIVSSICIRDALCRAGYHTDLAIYVEKRSPVGVPQDLDFVYAEDPTEPVQNEWYGDLHKELWWYHRNFRPHSNADVIYIRRERPSLG